MPVPVRRALPPFLLPALLLAVWSCAAPLTYVHPETDLSYVERVALVPFKNLTQEKHAEGKVMNVVATELLRRRVEVVEFGEVSKVLRSEGYGGEEGVISKAMALNAGKRLDVQAFMLGAVQEYGPGSGGGSYPEVALSLKLVDADSYAILWEATHNVQGGTVMDRLFGIGHKSTSDLTREAVAQMLDTLTARSRP